MATIPYDDGQLLRQLVDGITDYAIYRLDAAGNITTWNTGATRLKGYTADEVLGRSYAGFFLPEEQARDLPQTLLDRAAADGHAQAEGWRVRKDGASFWAHDSLTAFYAPDGSLTGYANITRDRTEAYAFEQRIRHDAGQLAENEQRYRSLFEQSPDAIFVNQDQRVVLANQACLHLFGARKAEQLIGLPILKLFHPDYWDKVVARVTVLLEQGRPVPLLEEQIVRLDGRAVDVEVKAAPFIHDGAPAIHVILRDITERKQAEAALRRLTVELEQRVAERTDELQARNRELEAFTYSVSHDLKAPLRGIDGYARILYEEYAEALDAEGRRYAVGIRRAAGQMSRLIEDLLAWSRVERRPVQTGLVDLPALVATLLEERAPDLVSQHVAVTVSLPPEPITADPEALAQALRNLLDNALKFSSSDAGSPRQPALELGGQRTPDAAQLWVKDNGIGFDMAYHDRIFDIFQRLHTRDDYPGTGVGLAIVRRAVERMGGRTWATSAPGRGATFFLEIPQPY